jgi:Flavin containing amine oxidoreductase/TAT (twin-arginine translocation) pathway signal sequence
MARTPLLRALQRLAWEHRAASQLGMEVEELRERGEIPGVSRRAFLKGAGVAGAAAAVAGPLAFARPARAAAAPRIAIIGGGIAGLAAALTLQDKGVGADVYESSGRMGGRMHSDWQEFGTSFWANKQQAELCGELIDTNHKTILQLAQRFKLATIDLIGAQPNMTTDTYWISGAQYPYAQASTDFKPVHMTLQGQVQAAGYPTPPTTRSMAPRRPASQRSDQPFQSAWEVTRGQSGTTGILVEYPGANVAQSMGQPSPYTTTATNPNVATYANQFLSQIEPIFPGITAQWNGKAMLSTPSLTRTSSALTPTGSPASTPASAATKACARATSTSPENTAPSTSKASWKAAPPKASAPQTKSSPTSKCSSPHPHQSLRRPDPGAEPALSRRPSVRAGQGPGGACVVWEAVTPRPCNGVPQLGRTWVPAAAARLSRLRSSEANILMWPPNGSNSHR